LTLYTCFSFVDSISILYIANSIMSNVVVEV
jgi:hypothetical protein